MGRDHHVKRTPERVAHGKGAIGHDLGRAKVMNACRGGTCVPRNRDASFKAANAGSFEDDSVFSMV